jgi:uncharacterized integral membrane protein (TIGR00698 family)
MAQAEPDQRLFAGRLRRLSPGLLLAVAVAGAAHGVAPALRSIGVVASPMVVSLLLGLVLAQVVAMPQVARPGLDFACRSLLRFAIVLMGLRVGLPQVAAVGGGGVLAISALVAMTLLVGYAICRWFGLSANLAWLLASGHAICGAAAVAAADSVLGAKERDVARALTLVTLFGTVTMLLLPLFGMWLQLDAGAYGAWVGGCAHEVAQALAAGFALGPEAGEVASVIKLVRVAHLLPLGLVLTVVAARRALGQRRGRIVVPWFVLGFAAVAILDALGLVPGAIASPLRFLSAFVMTWSMAALGLKSSLRELAGVGLGALFACALLTTWVVGAAFCLVMRYGGFSGS